MINVSNEFKTIIKGKNRKFYGGATITLLDGNVLTLDNTKIIGLKIDDATSEDGKFTLGSAIINKLTLTIDNLSGEFSDYDFTGAVIRPTVGLQLSASIETLSKGVFTAEDPKAINSIISISSLDNMSKFDKDFKDVEIAFPTTAYFLLSAVCLHCGVSLATTSFTNQDYIITERPIDDALNCREVISWIAQLSGNFARINTSGTLELKWYDFEVFERTNLDGGKFDSATPYATGDDADGGDFTDYNLGDTFDGGTFDDFDRYHHFYSLRNISAATDDVVITGIQVTDSAETPTTVLFGQLGYVVSIEGNKLIQTPTDAQIIADSVGAKIVGMEFRPLSTTTQSDPSIEAGDVAYTSDHKGNSYQTLVTNTTYAIGNPQSIKCDAEPPSRNSSKRFSADSKVIVEARKFTVSKVTAYGLAQQSFNNLVFNSMGVYRSYEELPDGSKIEYAHDKPTYAESMNIWKQTGSVSAVSNDGGVTWRGTDADGNILANVLTAIGINADWIKLGKIMSTDGATLIDMDLGVANHDNFNATDNVASGYPLRMPFNIDDGVGSISKVLLKYSMDKFRTYSNGASSGGNSIVTSSTSQTYVATLPMIITSDTGSTTSTDGVPHTHTFNASHQDVFSDDGHEHSVSVPSHSHGLNFGIMETSITNYAIEVWVDNTLRTSIANNIANIQGIIDLTAWITTTGWHSIELRSTTLKRISATVNVKSYIKN